MIVSRSADYALRALIYLARLDSPRYVPTSEIANEMQTPPFLLSRILQYLTKGDFLLSMKGHHGGFKLKKSPEEITIHEVIQLIDGPFVVHDCSGNCGLSHDCNLQGLFSVAEERLADVFKNITLADASRPHKRRGAVEVKNSVYLASGVD